MLWMYVGLCRIFQWIILIMLQTSWLTFVAATSWGAKYLTALCWDWRRLYPYRHWAMRYFLSHQQLRGKMMVKAVAAECLISAVEWFLFLAASQPTCLPSSPPSNHNRYYQDLKLCFPNAAIQKKLSLANLLLTIGCQLLYEQTPCLWCLW